jgi:RNA polymerase sigma-70 factor (ECF subfamily)
MIAEMAVDDRIAQARKGDGAAFDALAAERVDRLFAIASLILRDPSAAQDAVQEALLRAWRDLPGLHRLDRFEAWLHRILVRACYDEVRARKRLTTVVRTIGTEAVAPDPGSTLADREQLDRGFRRLSPEHRAAIVLQYYVGLSTREAADVLGIPTGTLKSRTHFATRALRAALDADAREGTPHGSRGDR